MATFTERIQSANDDGYKQSSTWKPSDSIIVVGKDSAGFTAGWRFSGITIPQGATINSASISAIALTVFDGSTTLSTIFGIAEDNTSDFSSDPTGRTHTSANTNWNLSPLVAGNTYTTPDLAAIIQEIVNRGGWASGNAMGFLIPDNGSSNFNNHGFYSYDNDSTKAAQLTIDYTAPTTTTTSTSTSTTTTSTSSSTTTTTTTSTSSSTTTTSTSTTITGTTTSTSTTTTSTSTTTTSTSTTTTVSTSTSTTTTSTSITTTSTSTTTLPTSDYYGIKVFKAGVPKTTHSPKDLFMNTHYPLIKVHQRGSFKLTYIKGSGAALTIPFPNLGYRPFSLVFCQRKNHDGSTDADYHMLEWSYWGASKVGWQRYKTFQDHILIEYEDNLVDDLSLGTFTLIGYYYIFKEAV